jgi:tetratricopeptide (TPR) repeat protein
LIIPFKIDVDLNNTQLESFRKELRSDRGFTWESWNQAALYCVQHKTNLEEALTWANTAIGVDFGGSRSFQAWSTKAAVLDSLGRGEEAVATMKKALPYADKNELYFYARNLTRHNKGKEALEIFKMDYDKNPDEFLTNAGMARGYSAVGDYKKALTYAQKAKAQATDQPNKDIADSFIKKLQDGKDIN